MSFRAWKRGFRIAEIPIVFVDRTEGESKMSKHIVREAVWMVWRLRWWAMTGAGLMMRRAARSTRCAGRGTTSSFSTPRELRPASWRRPSVIQRAVRAGDRGRCRRRRLPGAVGGRRDVRMAYLQQRRVAGVALRQRDPVHDAARGRAGRRGSGRLRHRDRRGSAARRDRGRDAPRSSCARSRICGPTRPRSQRGPERTGSGSRWQACHTWSCASPTSTPSTSSVAAGRCGSIRRCADGCERQLRRAGRRWVADANVRARSGG